MEKGVQAHKIWTKTIGNLNKYLQPSWAEGWFPHWSQLTHLSAWQQRPVHSGPEWFQALPYQTQIHLCLWSNHSCCLGWQRRATKQRRRWSVENNLEMNWDSWLKVTDPRDLIHTVLCLLIDLWLWLFFFLRAGVLWITNRESKRREKNADLVSTIEDGRLIDSIPLQNFGVLKMHLLCSGFQESLKPFYSSPLLK